MKEATCDGFTADAMMENDSLGLPEIVEPTKERTKRTLTHSGSLVELYQDCFDVVLTLMLSAASVQGSPPPTMADVIAGTATLFIQRARYE